MKKVLLTLLAVIVSLGVLAGAGFAGYRIGYMNGATGSGNAPAFERFSHMDPDLMPMRNFGREFGPGYQYRYPMMGRGGFGFASLLHFLWNIVVLGLVIWFVYWLFTKSGWRITRQANKDQEISEVKTEG